MKKMLLVTLAALMLTMSMTSVLKAQEEETDCPCGMDEAGECLPCEGE